MAESPLWDAFDSSSKKGAESDLWAEFDKANPPPGLTDRVKQGFRSTVAAGKISLTDDPERIAGVISENEKTRLPQSQAALAMQEEIKPYAKAAEEANGPDAVGKWAILAAKRFQQFVSNPREFAGMIAENLSNSAPGMAGMVVGGVGGSYVAGPVGGVVGSIAGGTAGGYAIEQGSAMIEQVTKGAQAAGININDTQALAQYIAANYPDLLEKSRLKGIGTAGTDAILNRLTLGLAGLGERAIVRDAKSISAGMKAGTVTANEGAASVAELQAKEAARNTLGAKVARGTGVVTAEMGGEMASEAAGQALAYGKVDPLEVIDEGLVGIGQGAVMAAGRGTFNRVTGSSGDSVSDAIAKTATDVAAFRAQEQRAARDAAVVGNIAAAPDVETAIAEAAKGVAELPEITGGPVTQEQQIWVNKRIAQEKVIADRQAQLEAEINARREADYSKIVQESRLPAAEFDVARDQQTGAAAVAEAPSAMQLAFQKAQERSQARRGGVTEPTQPATASAAVMPEWAAFPPESGTLGVPRKDMPQIKAEHRGPMVNFLEARGITHTQEEVPASSLKATQAEYSPAKVEKAKTFEGGDRSILISSDNHIVDGHHQALAKGDEAIKVIRLNAPIRDLLPVVAEFPSAKTAQASAPSKEPDGPLTPTPVVTPPPTTKPADTVEEKPVGLRQEPKYGGVLVSRIPPGALRSVAKGKDKRRAASAADGLLWLEEKKAFDAAQREAEAIRRAEDRRLRSESAQARRDAKDTPSRDLLDVVMKNGGVNKDYALDVAGDKGVRGLGGLAARIFRTQKRGPSGVIQEGHGLDETAVALWEAGYMTREELDENGSQIASDLLRQAIDGTLGPVTEDQIQKNSQREQRARQDKEDAEAAARVVGAEATPDNAEATMSVADALGMLSQEEIDGLDEKFGHLTDPDDFAAAVVNYAKEKQNADNNDAEATTGRSEDTTGQEARTEERRAEGENRVEKRQDAAQRKRVADMTPEEKDRALLTDRLTGLHNDRWLDENIDAHSHIVAFDADSLKWVNDNLGHEQGDKLLEAWGEAIKSATNMGARVGGDEFFALADSKMQAEVIAAKVKGALNRATITAETPGGEITIQGIGVSFGIGTDRKTADEKLNQHKQAREASGERAGRGQEPPGVTRKPTQRQQDQVDQDQRQDDQVAPLELASQSPEEAKSEADAAQAKADEQAATDRKAEEEARAEREKKEIAQRSEAAADDFTLAPTAAVDKATQKKADTQEAERQLSGSRDMFAQPNPTPNPMVAAANAMIDAANAIKAAVEPKADEQSAPKVEAQPEAQATLSEADAGLVQTLSEVYDAKGNDGYYALSGDGNRDRRKLVMMQMLGRPAKSSELTLKALTAATVKRLGGDPENMAPVEQEQFIRDWALEKRLIQLGDAQTTYLQGDKAIYTGEKSTSFGGEFYQVLMMEGSQKGRIQVTKIAPGTVAAGRTAPKPIQGPTPQVASPSQLKTFIGIAADSIEQLRKVDVDRVLTSNPIIYQASIASHIKEKRPDLAQEVDDVLAEAEQPAQPQPAEGKAGLLNTPEAAGTNDDGQRDIQTAKETDTGTAMFSRKSEGTKGISVTDAQATHDRIARNFSNMAPVTILNNPSELPAKSKDLRDQIEKSGAMNDVEAAYYDGEIFVFADNLASEERLETVLFEHEVTHYGLRGVFGKDLNPMLNGLMARNPELRKKATQARQRLGLDSNVAAVEEVLADMPDSELMQLKGIDKFISAVRDWLAKHGFIKLADRMDKLLVNRAGEQAVADALVGDIVRAARDFARNGKPERSQLYMGGTRFMTAYHGSPHDFDEFSLNNIGTGEGAQAYGYGLYFAGKRAVAEHYRESLSNGGRGGLSLAGVMPSAGNKGLSDSAWVSAKKLSEFLVPNASVVKSFGDLDVEGRSSVLSMVSRLIQDGKILDAVIRFIPVDVVNMLAGKQYTPQYLLDHPTMLIYLLPSDANNLVARDIQAMNILAPAVALAAAKVHTGLGRFDVAPSDFLTASSALRHNVPSSVSSKIPQPSEFVKGRLYQVDLAPQDDEYLLWDKPLSEQSEKVKAALKDAFDGIVNRQTDYKKASDLSIDYPKILGRGLWTGEQAYREIAKQLNEDWRGQEGDDEAASKYLASIGIPGIKYLDGSSRGRRSRSAIDNDIRETERDIEYIKKSPSESKRLAEYEARLETLRNERESEDGSYNYVIFDDKLVKVEAKFSRSISQQIMDKVPRAAQDVFRSDRKLNRVMSKVNTPFHISEIQPQFKPVYDEAQDFMHDVSRIALGSADKAIDLLPRVESWRDVLPKAAGGKGLKAASDQDIAAIHRALYAGTFYGGGNPMDGIVWTDDELKGKETFKRPIPAQLKNNPLNDAQIKLYRQGLAAVADSLEEHSKALVWRIGRNVGVKLDNGMTLADMSETAREQADDQITDKSVELEYLTDEDRINAEAEQIAADAEGDPRDPRGSKAAARYRAEQKKAAEKVQKEIDELESFKAAVDDIDTKTTTLIEKGYFPAMRFGEYFVDVYEKDKGGKVDRKYFARIESQADQNRIIREMRAKYPDATIDHGIMNTSAHKLMAGMSLDTMEMFVDHIKTAMGDSADLDPLMQEFLRMATTERSTLAREIHRKGVPGQSEDITRVLAQFITGNARNAASTYHTADMLKSVREIDDGDVARYATDYVRYLQDPAEGASKLRGFIANYYLMGSVAFGAVNMTQPALVTMPKLSEYVGAAKATAYVVTAAKSVVRGKATLPKGEREAFERAEKDGVVSPQEIHQLRAESGTSLTEGPLWRATQRAAKAIGVSLPSGLTARKALFAWGSIYSLTEQFNRGTSFLAAYRLAIDEKMDDPYAFASKMVDETQFTYSKANRPEVMRGPVGAVVLQFKQFTISYIELAARLYKTDKAAFGVMMLMLFAMAGMEGLPFSEDIEDAIDSIGQKLGYATNSKKTMRKLATELAGPMMADILLHGVSAVPGFPLDVSSRVGMHNIIPGSSLFKTSEPDKTREIMNALGPTAGIADRLVLKGDMAALLPKAIQDLVKSKDMAVHDMYRDAKGKKVIETDLADAFFKGVGFVPASVARANRIEYQEKQDIDLVKTVESGIAGKWAEGIFEKDQDKVSAAREKLKQWNEDNPQLPIRINMGQIVSRVREMNKTREQRFVKAAAPEIRGTISREMREAR